MSTPFNATLIYSENGPGLETPLYSTNTPVHIQGTPTLVNSITPDGSMPLAKLVNTVPVNSIIGRRLTTGSPQILTPSQAISVLNSDGSLDEILDEYVRISDEDISIGNLVNQPIQDLTNLSSSLASQEQIREFRVNANTTNTFIVPFTDFGTLANEKYLERESGFVSNADLEARGASSADATDVLINSGTKLATSTLAFGGTSANATTMITSNSRLGKSVFFNSLNAQRVSTNEAYDVNNFSGYGWFTTNTDTGLPTLVAGSVNGTPNVYLNSSLGVVLEKSLEAGGFSGIKFYSLNQPMFFGFSYNNSTSTAVIVQNSQATSGTYSKVFSPGTVVYGARSANSRYFDGNLKIKMSSNTSTTPEVLKKVYKNTYSLYYPDVRIAKPMPSRFNGTKKIFIILGQSNADGRGFVSGLDTWNINPNLTIPEAEIFNPATNTFQPLKFGTNSNSNPSNALGTSTDTQFGVELNMANHLTEKYGRVGFIKLASGGTGLHNFWLPSLSNLGYSIFKNSYLDPALLALANTDYEIAGFIWIQGENDAVDNRSTLQYQADLVSLVSQIRIDTAKPNLPAYIVQLAYRNSDTSLPPYLNIRTAQSNYVGANSNTSLVLVDDLQKQDDFHYNALGFLTLGERIAKAIIN